jgi:cell division protein FtsB
MSFGLYKDRVSERRRRSLVKTLVKWSAGVAIVGAAGFYAYQIGSNLAQKDVRELKAEVAKLSKTVVGLKRENARLRAQAMKVKARERKLTERFRRELPPENTRALIAKLKERLDAGVGEDRLAFVIGAAEKLRSCEDAPVTRRFIVKTPIYEGANDSVTFAENTITVTAEGVSEKTPEGRPEAWFDPAQPVTARFARIGGEVSEVTGLLPLHHSVVISSTEYKFSVIKGARGFVKITGDRCRYP